MLFFIKKKIHSKREAKGIENYGSEIMCKMSCFIEVNLFVHGLIRLLF